MDLILSFLATQRQTCTCQMQVHCAECPRGKNPGCVSRKTVRVLCMSCTMQSMVSTFGCVGDGQTLLANERAPSALHSHGVGLQTAEMDGSDALEPDKEIKATLTFDILLGDACGTSMKRAHELRACATLPSTPSTHVWDQRVVPLADWKHEQSPRCFGRWQVTSLIAICCQRWTVRRVHGRSGRPAENPDTQCLVLGLDGVLCASAEEASIAACRAAYVLWPQVMKNAQEMTLNEAGVRQSWVDYDWEQLLEHRSSKLSPAPPWLLYKVQQLRPACRAEWELIVFARLCVEEAIACRANRAKGRAGARPLTVGEIESNWSESCGLRDLLLARWVPNIKDLQEAMADSRRQSSCSLLEETKFFGEVLELVHLAVASGAVEESVHCITSRDQLSAVQSLQMSGECIEHLSSPPDHQGSWAGKDGWKLHSNLGTVEEKVAAVHSIASRGYGENLVIVDDSVAFLQACAAELNLGGAQLCLATWGYVSHGHWADGRSRLPRVKELQTAADLAAIIDFRPDREENGPLTAWTCRDIWLKHQLKDSGAIIQPHKVGAMFSFLAPWLARWNGMAPKSSTTACEEFSGAMFGGASSIAGGQTQLGPTMFNVYGRASGLEEIQNKQGTDRVDNVLWLEAALMNYMKNPRVMASGRVQMNFSGIKDFQTRVDIVHYLKTLDWNNHEIANPPEKPASFAPARWFSKS
eukprot:s786_g13.t1